MHYKKHYFSLLMMLLFSIMAGCSPTVKVKPSKKPIVVNMTINIQHELRVKMQKDLDETIHKNPDIF